MSNNLINRLKYYVLQLGDPEPYPYPTPTPTPTLPLPPLRSQALDVEELRVCVATGADSTSYRDLLEVSIWELAGCRLDPEQWYCSCAEALAVMGCQLELGTLPTCRVPPCP